MNIATELLGKIKQSIVATDPAATLILYGSRARGDNRPDSDIDLLILLDKEKVTIEDRKRIGNPIYRLELDCEIDISLAIFSKSTWESKHIVSPFNKNVIKDGIRP